MSVFWVEKLFLWLIIYSVIGWVYESILCSVEQRKLVNRGFLNGPYCPIYGFGAVLDILILGKITNPFLLFVFGVILTCSLEYLTSWAMEKLFHARWWDYSERKFNIKGRICLLGAVVFGLFSVVLIKYIHPHIEKITNKLSPVNFHLLFVILFVGFMADIVITVMGILKFNKKLHELTEEIKIQKNKAKLMAENYKNTVANRLKDSEVYHSVTLALDEFMQKINYQERRMIKAFPKMKSLHYNDALSEFRTRLKKIKEHKS